MFLAIKMAFKGMLAFIILVLQYLLLPEAHLSYNWSSFIRLSMIQIIFVCFFSFQPIPHQLHSHSPYMLRYHITLVPILFIVINFSYENSIHLLHKTLVCCCCLFSSNMFYVCDSHQIKNMHEWKKSKKKVVDLFIG